MSFHPSARLTADTDLRLLHEGEVLLGGSPTSLMRLTGGGAGLVKRWFDGAPIGPAEAHQELARRLVARGLAHLHHRPAGPRLSDLTIVVPVKDDPDGLVTTLRLLAADDGPPDVLPVVIVDDGSADPVHVGDLRRRLGPTPRLAITVVRLAANRGPAAARNHGVDLVTTNQVLFVDAGVAISRTQAAELVGELVDPETVITAPRVISAWSTRPDTAHHGPVSVSSQLISDYERRWSPLDLGPRSGIVGPNRRLSYVPSTCLAMRTTTFRHVGGFDPELRYGEDVDLVWRAAQQGWVRYVADTVVTHPPRSTLEGFVRQRFRYGTAAGPLARRHPANLAPVVLGPAMAVFWAALASRRLIRLPLALASAVWAYRRLKTTLGAALPSGQSPRPLAGKLLAEGIVGSGLGLTAAVWRSWLPAALGLGLTRCKIVRLPLAAGLLRRLSRSDPRAAVVDIGVGVVDDLAYSLGVWSGAVRARTLRPLLPSFGDRPTGR